MFWGQFGKITKANRRKIACQHLLYTKSYDNSELLSFTKPLSIYNNFTLNFVYFEDILDRSVFVDFWRLDTVLADHCSAITWDFFRFLGKSTVSSCGQYTMMFRKNEVNEQRCYNTQYIIVDFCLSGRLCEIFHVV